MLQQVLSNTTHEKLKFRVQAVSTLHQVLCCSRQWYREAQVTYICSCDGRRHVICKYITVIQVRVATTSLLWTQLESWACWPGFCVVLPSYSKQMPGWYHVIGHTHTFSPVLSNPPLRGFGPLSNYADAWSVQQIPPVVFSVFLTGAATISSK
jgi:hypothetical protein